MAENVRSGKLVGIDAMAETTEEIVECLMDSFSRASDCDWIDALESEPFTHLQTEPDLAQYEELLSNAFSGLPTVSWALFTARTAHSQITVSIQSIRYSLARPHANTHIA
jgi:hypothetical protein